MPLRIKATHKAVNSALQPGSAHIWISDNLLRETFDRFVSIRTPQCKRFGCNVPGPLEARRRLAKRRLNHLSSERCSIAPPLDPALTFGWFGGIWARTADEPDWRWEPSGLEQRIPKSPYPLLPSWLDVKPPAPPQPIRDDFGEEGEASWLRQEPTEPTQMSIEEYKIRLACVEDLIGLRRLHSELRGTSLDATLCSDIALEHLLDLYRRHLDNSSLAPEYAKLLKESIFEFIQESSPPVRGVRLLRKLVNLLAVNVLSSSQCDTIILLFGKQLAEGQSASRGLVPVIRRILVLITKAYTSDSSLEALNNFWHAMAPLRLRPHQNRDTAIYEALLAHVLALPAKSETIRFAEEVVRCHASNYSAQDRHSERDRHGEAMNNWHAILSRCAQHFLDYYAQSAETIAGTELATFLRSLDRPDYVAGWAIKTTQHLSEGFIDSGTNRDLKLERLNSWLAALRGCEYSWSTEHLGSTWSHIFESLSASVRPVEILPQFAAVTDSEMPWILLRHWIRRSITGNAKYPAAKCTARGTGEQPMKASLDDELPMSPPTVMKETDYKAFIVASYNSAINNPLWNQPAPLSAASDTTRSDPQISDTNTTVDGALATEAAIHDFSVLSDAESSSGTADAVVPCPRLGSDMPLAASYSESQSGPGGFLFSSAVDRTLSVQNSEQSLEVDVVTNVNVETRPRNKLHCAGRMDVSLAESWSTPPAAISREGIFKLIQEEFMACCTESFYQPCRMPTQAVLFVGIIRALKRCELPTEDAIEHFLELPLALGQRNVFDGFARGVKRSLGEHFTVRHRPLLQRYVERHSSTHPEQALRVFNLDRRLHLTQCPSLLLSLISSPASTIHPKRILALLWHTDPSAHTHPKTRQYHPDCALTPWRIHLAHEAALAFANAPRFSARSAWVCVTRCLFFLRSHRAPVGPMMSRALVVAGLTRAMAEGREVEVGRVRFVLGVVAGVEGQEVADGIDGLVLDYQRRVWAGLVRPVGGQKVKGSGGGGGEAGRIN